jgi:hypothetical protein
MSLPPYCRCSLNPCGPSVPLLPFARHISTCHSCVLGSATADVRPNFCVYVSLRLLSRCFSGTRNATQVRTHAQKYFMRLARSSKQGGDGFKACDLGPGTLSERDDGDFDSISFSGNLGAENAAAAAAAAACGEAGTSASAAAAFLAKNIQYRDGHAGSSSQVASQQAQGSSSHSNGRASKPSTQHQQKQQQQQKMLHISAETGVNPKRHFF